MEFFMAYRSVSIKHWLPIVTVCPVNKLPDLIYVTVQFEDMKFHELYTIRKRIRKIASWKCMFMEDIAELMFREFKGCSSVTVALLFGRHQVTRR
jgi:hypothetical protein